MSRNYVRLTAEEKEQRKKDRQHQRYIASVLRGINAQKAQKPVKEMTINVEWVRNQTWGNCPRADVNITYHDGTRSKISTRSVTGSGYCKESQLISNILGQTLAYKLYQVDTLDKDSYLNEYVNHGVTIRYFPGSCGVVPYYTICKYLGGELKKIGSGKRHDTYLYTDKPEVPVGSVLEDPPNPLGFLGALMKMTEIVAPSEEDAVNSKARLLSAGTGISIPDDWNSLSLEERQRRLSLIEKELA